MTDDDLATLIRHDVSRDEPHWLPDVGVPLTAGRRGVRRRRALTGVVGAAAVAVAGVLAVPLLGSSDGTERALDPAEQALAEYDAQLMPTTLEQHSRAVLERSVPDLGPATFVAGDGQGQALSPELYDKASGMSVRFGTDDHYYSVSLDHAKSEAEGSAKEYCETGLAEGYDLACTVTRDAHGNVVISRLSAARPMAGAPGETTYMAVTKDELDEVNPNRLFFFRGVKVIKSESLVTYAEEVIRARDLDTAEAGFLVPQADWAELGGDPALVIPEPPTDDSGCGPWTQDPGVSYSC